MKIRTVVAALLWAVCGLALADDGATAAKAFWQVFAQGDVAKLTDHYADEVVLRAGSEFLKAEWGLNAAGDRNKDLTVKRADLLKAYAAMLTKLGKDKWVRVFGAVGEDELTTKALPNGHVSLIVKTGPGDDQLEYEFAPSADGTKWQVVAERTDY